MKRPVILLLIAGFAFIGSHANAQLMLGLGMDLFKTDNHGIAEKAQIGLEADYFLTRSFAVLGGLELWTGGPSNVNLAFGGRFYPVNPVYLKFRGLIGNQADVSFGLGYAHALDRNWRLEGGGDFFFNAEEFALRIGMAYRL